MADIFTMGRWDKEDGLFIEWDGEGKIVLRKNGIDYKQGFDEFIDNCDKPGRTLIGYEMGVSCYTEILWSDNILPLEKLREEDDVYGEPTEEDIQNVANSTEQYYWYGENKYVIAKRFC